MYEISGSSAKPEEDDDGKGREEGELEEEDEEEDIDEDELYLRLVALRSMAPDLEVAEVEEVNSASKESDENRVDELLELIDEADEAAVAPSDANAVPKVASAAVADSEDDDEDDIECYMKTVNTTASYLQSEPTAGTPTEEGKEEDNLAFLMQKLRKSLERQKEKENSELLEKQQEHYSPSQSPLREDFSPILSDGEAPSPPPAGNAFEDITSPPALVESDLSLSSPTSSLPDHDPVEKAPVANGSAVKKSAAAATKRGKSPSIERGCNLDAVPMEITSENEAEIEFFRSQKQLNDSLFPTSVWDFAADASGPRFDAYWKAVTTEQRRSVRVPPPLPPPLPAVAAPTKPPAKRRRRKRSSKAKRALEAAKKAKVSATAAAVVPEVVQLDSDSDDPDALRNSLLKDLALKRGATVAAEVPQAKATRQSTDTVTTGSIATPPPATVPPTTSTTKPKVIAASKPATAPVKPTVPKSSPKSKATPKNATTSKLAKLAVQKSSSATRQVAKKSSPLLLRTSSPRGESVDVKRLEAIPSLKKKYFPNLYKKVIIPLVEQPKPQREPPPRDMGILSGLDELLKAGRRDAEQRKKKKRTPPPKPVRKNPPATLAPKPVVAHPPQKVSVNLSSLFSPAEKRSLIRSSIKHLPTAKQKEYQQLVTRIRQIHMKKVSDDADKFSVTAAKTPEETEAEMRKKLIASMAAAKAKKVGPKKNPTSAAEVAMAKLSASNANEKKPSPKKVAPPTEKPAAAPLLADERRKGLDPERRKTLDRLESSVVEKRKDLTDSLFKMSAQISTLKGEKEQLRKSKELAAQLHKKLQAALAFVAKKEERISELSTSVRATHGQVNRKRADVKRLEDECKAAGAEFLGSSYSAPSDHSVAIKKKLESIKSNTESLQKVATAAEEEELADPSSPPPPPASAATSANAVPLGGGKSVVSGLSSSLSHLRAAGGSGGRQEIDPHKEFCRYELQGRCNDDTCPYQHHSK